MYLNKIITQTQHSISRFLIIANQPKVEKVSNNILLEYDKICSEILISRNKIIKGSSHLVNKAIIKHHKKSGLFQELFDHRNDDNLQREILSKIIIVEFSELSIRFDRLKFCFGDNSQTLRNNINETITVNVEIFKNSLKEYLTALYIYNHYYSESNLNISSNNKQVKRIYFPKQKEVLSLLVQNNILNYNDTFQWKEGCLNGESKDQAILLVKLKNLNLIKINNKSATIRYFNNLLNVKIHEGTLGEILKLNLHNQLPKKDKETMKQLSFLDKV